ncbi:MAG TPA: hypothetical protein VFR15_18470 [Chloroflexia bacterium]|nr:hypothetical protein [Chloroflexia bacterium]
MRVRMAVRHAVFLAALVLPVVLAGCGGATKQAAAQVKPRPVAVGWELHTLDDVGVALSLPPGWQAFNMDKQALTDTIAELRKANPSIANALSSQVTSLAVQGIKFYAADLYSPSLAFGFATNLNIIRDGSTSIDNLDEAMTEAIAEVEKQFAGSLDGPVLRGKLKSGSGHQVGRLSYDVVLNAPGGVSMPLSINQYVASAGGDVYIVTCTTLMANRGDYASTFEAMAEGLYFLE